jgi:hypothetical protein
MKRKNPARGRACGIYAGLGFATSTPEYITFCEVCRIPASETLCPTCQAWCDAGRHIQLAARAMKACGNPSTLKKGKNHEQ